MNKYYNLSNFNKTIEIQPLFACSLDKNGIIYDVYSDESNIFKGEADIDIVGGKLILKDEFISIFSKETYLKMFVSIENVISSKEDIEEKVNMYIGNYTGAWYEVYIKKDPKDSNKILLVWFYSSELKYYDNRCKEEYTAYKELYENLPYSVCIYIDNKIRFINKSAIRFLKGNNISEFIGKEISDFILEDKLDLLLENIHSGNNKNICLKSKVKDVDSIIRESNIHISPIVFNKIKGVLFLFEETNNNKNIAYISKDNEIDKEIKNEKRRTEFFVNISHELRTPLNVIIGAIQLLNLQIDKGNIFDKNGKLAEYLSIVKFNALRLLRLVNNVIDITKIDSGINNLEYKKCNMISFIENITSSVVPYMENKNINMTFDTDNEEVIALIDPIKMETVILNFLSNAIKFTPEGGEVMINITTDSDINISIKDTGIGMDKDKIDVIFERFRQVGKGYVRNNEGSGIGLSLAKSILDGHGGSVKVRSELNKGSEFILSIPKIKDELCENVAEVYEYKIGSVDLELSDICYQK